MGWVIGFVIFALLSFIYELVQKGEEIQSKKDESEAIANKLRRYEIENERIKVEKEKLKLKKQDDKIVIGLSSSQLLYSSGLIIVGMVSVIVFFQQIYSI